MPIEEPPSTALIGFIKNTHGLYYGKVCELRMSVREWLGYIAETFPHFTRHSLEHSDEIVAQMSKWLFVIAEYVRRLHHLRAADVITRHQTLLGRFAFDDPSLERTVADVCVAHGLERYQLEDNERYPERRDVLDGVVNVRFLAILLRLGDLLDMSHDRACPLLLNAASPLPPDSLPHWTQYKRIRHRLTATDRIEIEAECETQEEHRVLHDWCRWIVDEASNAKTVMARSKRHSEWQLPVATFDPPQTTIKIRPAANVSYIFSEWRFELNTEAVLKRLIYDVHDTSLTFIRELLQNALDANRCQMYLDLQSSGMTTPEFPTQVDEETRKRYPVRIKLVNREVINQISGQAEKQQVLVVEDSGVGMDKDIVERYFLQIGRSFYTTDEFRKHFGFVPTSRFGVGFLSVFAVSDRVTVETYKRSSASGDGPLLLTLTGPRSYLLTEQGERSHTGTSISVSLRESMEAGALTKLVSEWCRRVEFPIIVDDLGEETVIRAERHEDFEYDIPAVTNDQTRMAVRAFPINRHGIEGELYVFSVRDEKGESWCEWGWAQVHYPQIHPEADKPPFPANLTCIHGLSIKADAPYRVQHMPMSARLDYRSDKYWPTLARDSANLKRAWGEGLPEGSLEPEVESRWQEILREHLETTPWARGEDGWRYKQGLIYYFPIPSFWDTVSETIRIHKGQTVRLISLAEARELPVMTVVINTPFRSARKMLSEDVQDDKPAPISDDNALNGNDPTIIARDFVSLGAHSRIGMLTDRHVAAARWSLQGNQLEIDWVRGVEEDKWMYSDHINALAIVVLPDRAAIGTAIHKATKSDMDCGLVNCDHPFIQWTQRVKEAS